jgi:hypothetical protein
MACIVTQESILNQGMLGSATDGFVQKMVMFC